MALGATEWDDDWGGQVRIAAADLVEQFIPMTHTPGRGHRRKSDPPKKRRFQKETERRKQKAQKTYLDAIRRWEQMTEEQRRLRPELDPMNFEP
jgi:hypothetical protein